MSNKIEVPLSKLHELALHSRRIGTERAWMRVALEWADGAQVYTRELESRLTKIQEHVDRQKADAELWENSSITSKELKALHKTIEEKG